MWLNTAPCDSSFNVAMGFTGSNIDVIFKLHAQRFTIRIVTNIASAASIGVRIQVFGEGLNLRQGI